jgi:hypothetical protein
VPVSFDKVPFATLLTVLRVLYNSNCQFLVSIFT